MRRCCKCGILALASPPNYYRTSLNYSHRRTDRSTALKADSESAYAWCNGWLKCTEALCRFIAHWVRAVSLSCVCR